MLWILGTPVGFIADTPTALDSMALGRGLAAHPGCPEPHLPHLPFKHPNRERLKNRRENVPLWSSILCGSKTVIGTQHLRYGAD